VRHFASEPGPGRPEIRRSRPFEETSDALHNPEESEESATIPEPEEPSPRPLAGWVFDRQGTPVPQLAVSAVARRVFVGTSGQRAAAGGRSWTRTGADGVFFFPQLADGEYVVSTEETDRYAATSATIRAGVDSAVLTVESKSGHPLRVYGTVRSDRWACLEGVRVDPVGQPQRATFTDEIGNYALLLQSQRGRVQPIRFRKEGFREARRTVSLNDAGGEVTLNVTLAHLGTMSTVRGSVKGDDGALVHLALVQLYCPTLGRNYRTASDRSGRFVFPEVEVGDGYRLWVHPPGRYRDHVQDSLVISSGGLEMPVVLETLGEASLSGQMVDPDGRPLPGVTLWLSTDSGRGPPIQVTGSSQGRFFVKTVPEGEVVLQTRASPLLSVSGIRVSGESANQVRLVLDLGEQTVGGHIQDPQGRTVAGARVALYWSHDGSGVRSRSRRETISDAAGYFLFTQLGSGIHTLSVTATGFSGTILDHRVGVDDPEVVIPLQEASP
jgi:hypothetical protein